MSRRFAEKIVVVTGATRGIGSAVAERFIEEGARVIGVARSETELAEGAEQRFTQIRFDFRKGNVADLSELVSSIARDFGKIDVLVNNAGIIRRAPALQYSEADWDEVLRVNLRSPFFLTQAVANWWVQQGMQQDGKGRLKIVNIASLLSFQGGILVPAYTASKHAIAGITKALANEWAPLRININAIAPGYIATENTRPLREDPQRNAAILSRIPEGRWGDPGDIAGGVLFLASPDADYVNGAIFNMDGGWLGR